MKFLSALGVWLLERMQEKSTYAGITVLAAVHSHNIPPAIMDAISWWGSFIAAGLIAVSTKPKANSE